MGRFAQSHRLAVFSATLLIAFPRIAAGTGDPRHRSPMRRAPRRPARSSHSSSRPRSIRSREWTSARCSPTRRARTA
jgi:hypothetical protein